MMQQRRRQRRASAPESQQDTRSSAIINTSTAGDSEEEDAPVALQQHSDDVEDNAKRDSGLDSSVGGDGDDSDRADSERDEGDDDDEDDKHNDDNDSGDDGQDDSAPASNQDEERQRARAERRRRKQIASLTTAPERFARFRKEVAERGIVYMSRVPPYMRPDKVRHLLGMYGEIGRIFLRPEDPYLYEKRKKAGGNRKKSYRDGWVEFADKRIAKSVAISLNNTPIGGKGWYAEDRWNLKYLSKYKWDHLTEEIANEVAVRDQKLRTELSRAQREDSHYLSRVQLKQTLDKIQAKRRAANKPLKQPEVRRSFAQRGVAEDDVRIAHDPELLEKLVPKLGKRRASEAGASDAQSSGSLRKRARKAQ